MIQQRRPGHSTRLEIIKQRLALTFSQRIAAARNQDARFFEQFTGGATNRCPSRRVFAVFNPCLSVRRIKLPAGKRMIAAEKLELLAAPDQIDFRIVWISLVTKENYCRGVFG
jgi:hypothetical protein